MAHFCQPIWDEFCNAAANASLNNFPTSAELLDERRKVAPVEWQLPEWEWVDPMSEQQSAESSLKMFMSTYQDELGGRGRSWRATYYQAAKERRLRLKLGLLTETEQTSQMMAAQTGTAGPADESTEALARAQLAMIGLSDKNIDAIVTDASDGTVDAPLPEEVAASE